MFEGWLEPHESDALFAHIKNLEQENKLLRKNGEFTKDSIVFWFVVIVAGGYLACDLAYEAGRNSVKLVKPIVQSYCPTPETQKRLLNMTKEQEKGWIAYWRSRGGS